VYAIIPRPVNAILPMATFPCLYKSLPNHGERFDLSIILRHYELGLLDFSGFSCEFILVDEQGYRDGVLRGYAEIVQFAGLDDGVLTLAVFVTIDDLIAFDAVTGLSAAAVTPPIVFPDGATSGKWLDTLAVQQQFQFALKDFASHVEF
jgi:hypothetical protein